MKNVGEIEKQECSRNVKVQVTYYKIYMCNTAYCIERMYQETYI